MPYHPDHRRVAPWQAAAALLVSALLLAVYLWSFRAGRARALDEPPPAIPTADGALAAAVAPSAPGPAPVTGRAPQRQ